MHTAATVHSSAAAAKTHLDSLERERHLAAITGLLDVEPYRRDLDEELAATHAAYVGAAVTEIATLRAELGGRLQG